MIRFAFLIRISPGKNMQILSKLALFFLVGSNLLFAAVPQSIPSYSQASQDRFAYLLLCKLLKEDKGYYLEIGSGHPSHTNNTYLFEKSLAWTGVSIDIDSRFQDVWSIERRNPLVIGDAALLDYEAILKSFPREIDYLSLDVDDNYVAILKRIFLSDHIFKVITIEHDFYRYGDQYRNEERAFLNAMGYYLICPDVSLFFNGRACIFEDWWIHPSAFSLEAFSMLKSLDLKGKMHNQIINTLERILIQN